jgi:hypothetical protein
VSAAPTPAHDSSSPGCAERSGARPCAPRAGRRPWRPATAHRHALPPSGAEPQNLLRRFATRPRRPPCACSADCACSPS